MTLGDKGRDAAVAAEPDVALASVGDVLLAPTRIYAREVLAARRALRMHGHDLRGIAHVTGGGLPGNVPRALPAGVGVRLDPMRWTMPSAMWLMGALGGLEEAELRATFNGGLGMVLVVAPGAAGELRDALPDAVLVGEVLPVETLGGRYVEGPLASVD
jgi:phosphoribosylformylglycinamidine cyclo-ligase